MVYEIITAERLLRNWTCAEKYQLVGSAMYMQNPNDVDYLILLKPATDPNYIAKELEIRENWVISKIESPDSPKFISIRNGNLNFLITTDREYYYGFVRAMEVCLALKLECKADRIKVCRIIRDGKMANDVNLVEWSDYT